MKQAVSSLVSAPVQAIVNRQLGGETHFFEETVNVSKIKKLLDRRSHNGQTGIHERIQGMKWLLAQVSKGRDVSQFFPDVVKNVIVKSVELKKLVYIFSA